VYQYDFFVSYKRESPDEQLITPWLYRVFERVKYWVRQELGQSVSVFIDTTNVEAGDTWPDSITEALLSARCLLAVWSTEYFQSQWCVREWRTFLAREQLISARGATGCKLIVPVTVQDGLKFPPEARRVQQVDISKYAATTNGFWETKRADDLEQKLISKVTPSLAKAVRQAPPFEPDWPLAPDDPPDSPPDTGMVRL
jgi:hypothetical protein